MTPRPFHWTHGLIGLALASLAGAAFGQAPPAVPDHPLSVKECVSLAVEQNPNVASYLHSGRYALAHVGASKAAYWPTLDLNGTLGRSYSEPQGTSSRSGLILGSATATATAATASAQYTLWDSGQRKAAVEGSQAGYEAADSNYQATALTLALQVESSFYTVQGAQWALEVSKDTLRQADLNYDAAKARNDVGLAARSDVLQAATTQANARLGVIQAEAALKTATATLANLMGFPADSILQIEPANRTFIPPQLPDWAQGWERAKTSLPEIKAAFATAESYRFAYLGAEAAYRPTVTANGTAGLFDSGSWPDRQEWSAGITLHVPVFTGFARKYVARQAKEAWEEYKANTQATILTAEQTAYQARISLDEAIQAVTAAEAYVASAQENSDVANGQYANGLGSQLNVIDAMAALSSARLSLISARLSVATAWVAWQRATGMDLLEGLTLPSTSQQRPDGAQSRGNR